MSVTVREFLDDGGRSPFREWLAGLDKGYWAKYLEETRHGKTK